MHLTSSGRPTAPQIAKVGIEIGGTFTDIIAVDAGGRVTTHKVSTTPSNPAIGSFEGLDEMKIDLSLLDTFLHGSTIATNAVLERKGAKTGLLTTHGFRDVLIIQRFDKKDSYNPFYRRPEPLIPRNRIKEIPERLGADGTELIPLNDDAVQRALLALVADGVESLAISFLHAYANADHERRAREFAYDAFPQLHISISSDVLPKFREYERTSTTVISAYVKPIVDRYLLEFERRLEEVQFGGAFLIMQANGGVVPSSGARASPASMYLSGPAAGVVGAQHLSRRAQLPNLLTLDVGGTSTDLALITDSRAMITSEGEIGGLPMALPMIDIVSIGAGGGSIAWRDRGGMLRVGPQSAGAQPGPVCYGRGGTQPTLTDALVVLGLIPSDRFLGGRMVLEIEAAQSAVEELARSYEMNALQMAESIARIAVANITQATRLVSIQRGHDPRRYAICAYGGAGPLLASLVAEQLSVPRVVVPPNPGLFSAFGLLVSDFKRDFTRSRLRRLTALTVADVRKDVDDLRSRAADEFASYGLTKDELRYETWLDLRYEGQGFELPIPIADSHLSGGDLSLVRELFNATHLARYGHNFPEHEVVLVSYRVTVSASREASYIHTEPARPTERRSGRVFFDGSWHTCAFRFRHELGSGDALNGPAVVSEDTATTFIPRGWAVRVDAIGNLVIDRSPA